MNKLVFLSSALLLLLAAMVSCKKSNSKAAPVISGVRTVYKTVTDSSTVYDITYTWTDSTGLKIDTTSFQSSTPNPVAFDSTVTSGNQGNLYAILGQHLSDPEQVLFNGTSVYFNPALGSDNSILVTIPQGTPAGPNQSNTLTVITTHGTATFAFGVLLPPPTISTESDFDFYAGSTISFTGVGFASVTAVTLSGSTDQATILAQSDSTLTLQFPTSSVNRANLVFTYGSGTVTSSQEFIDLDNAYQIFTDDFENGWVNNSWSYPSGVSTTYAKTGTASFQLNYPANAWQIEGAADWNGFSYNSAYKYLSFWIRGGSVQQILTLVGDQMAGGYGQNTSGSAFLLTIPPTVWTFFKIPLGTGTGQLNFWANGNTATEIGFFLEGTGSDPNEVMYVDDLIFVK